MFRTGVGGQPSLTSESSTHMLHPTPQHPLRNVTEEMNVKSGVATSSDSSRWSMGLSPPQSFLLVVDGTVSHGWVKRLASFIAEKYGQPYRSTSTWIWCKIAFSLIASAVVCLRACPSCHFHVCVYCTVLCYTHQSITHGPRPPQRVEHCQYWQQHKFVQQTKKQRFCAL